MHEEPAIRFLRLILPAKGYYIAAVKHAKGLHHVFCPTIEALWQTVLAEDRNGNDTYHACASYVHAVFDRREVPRPQRRLGRTQHNVSRARAFWIDIDVGKKNAYATIEIAARAVSDFCQRTGLPTPLIVGSGSGLHVYWPLDTELDRPTWQRYADGLKALCFRTELKFDPARTADIASVLRTPGTANRKGKAPLPVQISERFLEAIAPYPLERFAQLLDQEPLPVAVTSDLGPLPAHLVDRRKPEHFDAAFTPSYPDSQAAVIVEHCAQLRAMRDLKGNLPEPIWFAGVGVVAFTTDGQAVVHPWSEGHPTYSYEETQERFERCQQLSGPTLCARFHALNPAPCEACKHWGKIKSPISLGQHEPPTIQPQPDPSPPVHEAASLAPMAPPTAAQQSRFRGWELTGGGHLKPRSYVNTVLALQTLDLHFSHDVFHNRRHVMNGAQVNIELTDVTCRALRDQIILRWNFDPGIDNVHEAAKRACEEHQYDPLLDYLGTLKWDGQPRLGTWLAKYMGAEDTELNQVIGTKLLMAAVLRVRYPGTKWDQMVVFEGPQGIGKSKALRCLAGDQFFSDQALLHLDTRAQLEAMEGVWIYEISELAGLRRMEVETVKSFLSKSEDNARPAWGHFRVNKPRRVIFVGTTNDRVYLRDMTGNRRFWPVMTSTISLRALAADRDQLWAEACVRAETEDVALPRHLYEAARIEQERRTVEDPWEDQLSQVQGQVHPAPHGPHRDEERVSTVDLLAKYLNIPMERVNENATKRLSNVMHALGWQGPRKMRMNAHRYANGANEVYTVTLRGYWRPTQVKQYGEFDAERTDRGNQIS